MTLPSISNAYRSTVNYVRDHTATPSQMARNAQRIAPYAIPVIALGMLPGADGGPILCGLCLGTCLVTLKDLVQCAAICAIPCGVPSP